MQQNYTEKQLRTTIIKQQIEDHVYYYSICRKEQKSLSFLSNDRLLVLNFDAGQLFYVNETIKLPFHIIVPKPKKEFSYVNATLVRHTMGNKEICFDFTFNNEKITWKCEFETAELAGQWVKLIELQRESKQKQEKDIRALNKSIIEMPKIEQQTVKDIVKQPQRDIANDQSRLLNQMMGLTGSRIKSELNIQQSQIRKEPSQVRNDQSRSVSSNDWNKRFYENRDLQTLYQFQGVAIDAFFSSYRQDSMKKGELRVYENEYCQIRIANKFTKAAKKLKNEYRNYHFILEATFQRFMVGVPLCCLIEFQCVVALVKAHFPERVEKIIYGEISKQGFNQLQRYTRIKNKVLQNATLLNLALFYQPQIPLLIYVEDVSSYLPLNYQFPHEQTLVRPEYMLDNVNYFIYSNPEKDGKMQARELRQLSYRMLQQVKKFSNTFYLEQFKVCRIGDLKNLIHGAGFNLKFLPHMYTSCGHPQIKQYIYSAMAAKVVKDYVNQSMMKIRGNDEKIAFEPILEQTLSILLSGNNNKSHELWKEISLIFKRRFNLVLNHKDILPGFFFNSILELIPGTYDIGKINKKGRVIFQTQNIIEPGFVKQLQPKVKCFDRFLTKDMDDLKKQTINNSKSEQISQRIRRKLFNEKEKRFQNFYELGNNDEWMTEYLSFYYPPEQLASQNEDKINYIFDRVNEQPPSYYSLTVTKNYLEWCNKRYNTEQFKKVFQGAIQIADYWLDEIHPLRSDLLEILSDYYAILGSNEDMIKYMKDSLNIAIKFWGVNSLQAGMKQYELGDRYLRNGNKKEAVEFFTKSKDNLELNKAKTSKLGLIYVKLASIFLSDLQYQKATQYAKHSIEVFHEYERKINSIGILNEPYKIKAYELLSRIYEICQQRTDYKELALSCARKFNLTKNREVYQQMIRLCLASLIFKSTVERSQSFLKLAQNIEESNLLKASSQKLYPIDELMKMSEDMVVMQRFISKFDFMERSLSELSNPKKLYISEQNKQFVQILKNVVAIVGLEYVKGLVDEKVSSGY